LGATGSTFRNIYLGPTGATGSTLFFGNAKLYVDGSGNFYTANNQGATAAVGGSGSGGGSQWSTYAATQTVNMANFGFSNVGAILATSGTANAPTHSFVSDPSSGMHLVGGSQLAFDTSGVTRMVISNSNVGIGTNAPAYLLDVSGIGRFTSPTGIYLGPTGARLGVDTLGNFYTVNNAGTIGALGVTGPTGNTGPQGPVGTVAMASYNPSTTQAVGSSAGDQIVLWGATDATSTTGNTGLTYSAGYFTNSTGLTLPLLIKYTLVWNATQTGLDTFVWQGTSGQTIQTNGSQGIKYGENFYSAGAATTTSGYSTSSVNGFTMLLAPGSKMAIGINNGANSLTVQTASRLVITLLTAGPQGPTGTTGPTGPIGTISAPTQSIIPNANQVYDLGATGFTFRNVYLGPTGATGSTIYFGGAKLYVDGSGNFYTANNFGATAAVGGSGSGGGSAWSTYPASQNVNMATYGLSNVGTMLAVSGTATGPSHSFVSDPSSGIHLAGTSQLAFDTSGVTRMVISNSNVGIGTTGPTATLDVAGLMRSRIITSNLAGTSYSADLTSPTGNSVYYYITNTAFNSLTLTNPGSGNYNGVYGVFKNATTTGMSIGMNYSGATGPTGTLTLYSSNAATLIWNGSVYLQF
jgi:hypothetical protein